MVRFVSAVIVVVLLVVFTIQNIDQVEVQLPFIKDAFRIRLIYLLLTTYVLGYVTSHLSAMARQWKQSKKKKAKETEQNTTIDDYLQ